MLGFRQAPPFEPKPPRLCKALFRFISAHCARVELVAIFGSFYRLIHAYRRYGWWATAIPPQQCSSSGNLGLDLPRIGIFCFAFVPSRSCHFTKKRGDPVKKKIMQQDHKSKKKKKHTKKQTTKKKLALMEFSFLHLISEV